MFLKTSWKSIVCLLAVQSLFVATAAAQKPKGLGFFKKQTAAQGADVALKLEHGPWLIYAYSLEGPDSKMQALKLTAELRSSFGLKAYIMPKTFDYSNTVIGSGLSETGGEKKMRFADDRVVESYSILVGDFTSPDAPEAKETLKKVKTIKPNFFNSKLPHQTLKPPLPAKL